MEQLISVVIPAYNRETIITESINSVLQQTYQNIEVIVVDDCSQDNTVQVVKSIKDPRVKCYALDQNRGACYARNYGASLAKGAYIAFQDSDDLWLPEKLEKQFQYLLQSDYDLVFCGMDRKTVNGEKRFYYPESGYDEQDDPLMQILFKNRISTQCILLKANVMKRIQFDVNIKRYQDWDFAIQASQTCKIGYLSMPLVTSEIQSNSISVNVKRLNALRVIFDKHYNLIKKYPHVEARFYYELAEESWNKSKIEARDYYRLSLKHRFVIKTFIKYVASILGIKLSR